MCWRETCAVDERMRFVLAVEPQEEAFAALCRRFGVSRKTGYKWLDRYEAAGVEGLIDRSRAPHAHPRAVQGAVAERCLVESWPGVASSRYDVSAQACMRRRDR